MSKSKKHNHEALKPLLMGDCIVFGFDGNTLKVLLTERDKKPFKNKWAVLGDFIETNETVAECVDRVLLEETGLKNVFAEQFFTYTNIDRDPRERIISIAHYALLSPQQVSLFSKKKSEKIEWFDLKKLPKLGLDHADITKQGFEALQAKAKYTPLVFELLDKHFTLTQMQHVCEAIFQKAMDKRNFRKKILNMKIVDLLEEKDKKAVRKPVQYYTFNKAAYKQMLKEGIEFEIV